MGIRLLNRFLKNNTIGEKQYFSKLSNKKICVDVYNYIYQFLSNNRLIEDLEILCKLLHKHNIQALFVFDGKYNEQKKDEQVKRRHNREKANDKWTKLSIVENKTYRQQNKMKSLNRDRVKITKWDIHDAKKCLELCGMKYITANGEAEEFCSELVRKNKVFACMSEDTDLFAYGCKRIIKACNIYKQTFILYEMEKVLEYMEMELVDFQQICTLSCNDYSASNKNKHFMYFMELFFLYNEQKSPEETFIEWLNNNDKLNFCEFEKYKQIRNIYNLDNKNIFKNCKYIIIKNSKYLPKQVKQLSIDRENFLKEIYE